MIFKNIVSAILLLFVAVSLVYLVLDELRPGSVPEPVAVAAAPDQATPTVQDTLIAYYFHGDVRCKTCLDIEAFSREALTKAFAKEIASGRLRWQAVNFDERQNEHYLRDYELTTSSLVFVDMRGGEQKSWKTIEEVWALVSDKAALMAFVQSEARAYLESKP